MTENISKHSCVVKKNFTEKFYPYAERNKNERNKI